MILWGGRCQGEKRNNEKKKFQTSVALNFKPLNSTTKMNSLSVTLTTFLLDRSQSSFLCLKMTFFPSIPSSLLTGITWVLAGSPPCPACLQPSLLRSACCCLDDSFSAEDVVITPKPAGCPRRSPDGLISSNSLQPSSSSNRDLANRGYQPTFVSGSRATTAVNRVGMTYVLNSF